MVNFDTREGIMKQWDRWVKYYKAGGGASWPRDAFESLLDHFEEQIRQLSDRSNCTHENVISVPGGDVCEDCGKYL